MNRRRWVRNGMRLLLALCLLAVVATRLSEEAQGPQPVGTAVVREAAGPAPPERPDEGGSGAETEQRLLEAQAQQAAVAMRRVEAAYQEGQQVFETWQSAQLGPADLRSGSRYRDPLTEALRAVEAEEGNIPTGLRPRYYSLRDDLHVKLARIQSAEATSTFTSQ